jgi:CheY-like chemotaxis protein
MSGTLAHELSQPLTAVLSNAQAARLMLDRPELDVEQIRLALDDIIKNDRRAGAVIDRLRALLKKGDIELQPIDPNDVVKDVIDLAYGELTSRRVAVHSEGLGRGSRFSVVLPRGPIPAGLASPGPAPAGAASKVRCRALIVDDNHDSADTMAMMLKMLGHETHCVYDPRLTGDAVTTFAPDVAFLDIGMPGLSGYDVARSLRVEAGGLQLTLVAVTGWGHPDDRRRTAEAGFDHHLVKPADMATISAICNSLIPRSRHTV